MSVELVRKYANRVDELFKQESRISLLTNTDFDFTGAHSVAVWKISTVPMNDYARNRGEDYAESEASLSRFGKIIDLNTQTQEMLLTRDRSFIFNIDKMDMDETAHQLAAATALARQIREVAIPEIDSYVYGKMTANAGTIATAAALTPENIYSAIVTGTEVLDDNEVPDTGRVLVVSPSVYRTMKQSPDILLDCDISEEMRLKGVIAKVDGMAVTKVTSARLPENFGFMIAHPSATVAPTKLEDFGMHEDTCLSSGTIVTGRLVYDCFSLDNKKKAVYYWPVA